MTDTQMSILIAGIGVGLSAIISIVGIAISDRRAKEANRIAKEKADEANAIIKATADEANRIAKEANAKADETNRIAQAALELEKQKDEIRLVVAAYRLERPPFRTAQDRSKRTHFRGEIRNLGRSIRVAEVYALTREGDTIHKCPLTHIDGRRLRRHGEKLPLSNGERLILEGGYTSESNPNWARYAAATELVVETESGYSETFPIEHKPLV